MSRFGFALAALILVSLIAAVAAADGEKPEPAKAGAAPAGSVSFLKDVAPILVQNCVACHTTKKPESKCVMTTFAQFFKGGKSIATGGGDNEIRIWNPDNDGKQVGNIGGFGGPVFKLLYHPDGKQLIACSADKAVKVFDASNGSQIRVMQGHNDWIYAFALSSDGKSIASGSWDGEVRLWNLGDGKPLKTILAAPGLKAVARAEAK
jgi:WD40 repeat protein